jgi:D-alanyl-lipoteichoic acid acyltransferase DltB (MBOAT superfamily)
MQNFYVEYSFFIAVIVAIGLFRFASHSGSLQIRQITFISCNFYFLWQLSGHLLPMTMGYVFLILTAGYCMHRTSSKASRTIIFRISLTFFLGLLVIFKYPSYTNLFFGKQVFIEYLSTLEWIGLSYLTFRAIDFLIFQNSNRVKTFNLLSIFSYFTFFAPFISGPINRFAPFLKEESQKPIPLDFVRTRNNLLRISIGIIKILFLSKLAYANSIIAPEFQHIQPVPWWILTLSIYAYFFYIYFEFSGYCDVAIAIADFFGITVPENFMYPMFASNIQEFWNRWHISLSYWMRDHFFFPLLMALSSRIKFLPKILLSCICIFFTFILIGAWHGDKLHWVLYGAYHGLGLALYLLFNDTLTNRIPTLGERLRVNLIYRATCIFLTFNFVAWGLLLTLDFKDAKSVLDAKPIQWNYHLNFGKDGEGHFTAQGLKIIQSSEFLTLEAKSKSRGRTHFLMGGGNINKQAPDDGWPLATSGKYKGQLEGTMSSGGEVEMQVLFYDKNGKRLRKNSLGYMRSYSLPILFDFEGPPKAKRFNIILSSRAINWPQKFQLKRLKLTQVR